MLSVETMLTQFLFVSCHLKCSDLLLFKLAFLCVNTHMYVHTEKKFSSTDGASAAPDVKKISKLFLNFVGECQEKNLGAM